MNVIEDYEEMGEHGHLSHYVLGHDDIELVVNDIIERLRSEGCRPIADGHHMPAGQGFPVHWHQEVNEATIVLGRFELLTHTSDDVVESKILGGSGHVVVCMAEVKMCHTIRAMDTLQYYVVKWEPGGNHSRDDYNPCNEVSCPTALGRFSR